MEIYCAEKGIPVPEPKTETMKKERKSEESETEAEEKSTESETEIQPVENSIEDNVEDDIEDNSVEINGTVEETDYSKDSEESVSLNDKDADFANELKNRLYK